MKRRIISVMLAAMLALTPASASASPASLGTGSTEADSAVLEAIAQGAEIEMTKTPSGETEINVVEPETQEEAQTEPQTEETEPDVEVPGMPETETAPSLDSDPSADTDMPEEETSSGAAESEETETETEEQLYEVAVQDDEKDNAVVVFAADLLKLKNGTLENPNMDEAEAVEETEVDMSGVDIDTREEIGPPADTVNAGPGADLSMMPAAAAARAATVPVSKVAGNTKLDQNYAFTFAFRGDSALTSISRYNGTIPTKMHSWFGDSAGFTTEYCKTFYGALVESSGTYSSDISVVYSNVGEYQGQTLDLRVTADAWSGINKNHVGRDGTKIMPCILFYKDRIAFNTISVENVRFRFQFLKHGTSTAVNPKGHVTLADLDGGTIGQGIRLYPSLGIDRAYVRANDLKISYGSNYTEIRGGKDSTTNSDPDGWVTVNFNGAFGINWLAQGSVSTSTGPMNAFCIFTSQTVGIYEPNPGPEKRVGNQNQAYTAMAKHDSEGAALTTSCGNTFDYIIAQRLLPGNYSSFTLTDTLDSCLTYNSASVTTSGGRNVTNKFSITRSGQTVTFTMNNSFLKTDEAMNDVTYYFRIRVTLKNAATVITGSPASGKLLSKKAGRRSAGNAITLTATA